jgi:hypothetical protein
MHFASTPIVFGSPEEVPRIAGDVRNIGCDTFFKPGVVQSIDGDVKNAAATTIHTAGSISNVDVHSELIGFDETASDAGTN